MPRLSRLATATVLALLATPLFSGAPAHAEIVVPVDCENGDVTLTWDDTSYDLHGTCGEVRVLASNTHVTMPTATRLVVRGQDNVVTSKTLRELVVRGADHDVSAPSVRHLRLASPSSVVKVEGLVETALLRERRGTLTADQVSTLDVDGNRHVVRARRGYDARFEGDHNDVRFRRLEELVVVGAGNDGVVRRGETALRVRGSHNDIDVNRMA